MRIIFLCVFLLGCSDDAEILMDKKQMKEQERHRIETFMKNTDTLKLK